MSDSYFEEVCEAFSRESGFAKIQLNYPFAFIVFEALCEQLDTIISQIILFHIQFQQTRQSAQCLHHRCNNLMRQIIPPNVKTHECLPLSRTV